MDQIPQNKEYEFSNELSDIAVTKQEVEKKLLKLNTSKAPGDDQIHPKILKENAEIISDFLSILFTKSLVKGQLPSDWKAAVVVPLHKKGNKKKTENYRPVSLTSIVCKILESIIRDKLLWHMDTNNLFTIHQHGFRNSRSCVTQLLEVLEDWTEILDEGSCLDCIYLDFSKAFDTVPHQRLLNKLHNYGIRGKVRTWIENFLENRSQSVKIGNTRSVKANVISGIPQGSILGPILFLIFINDLPEVVQSTVKLFADDTKIYSRVNSQDEHNKLQGDLDNLATWSDTWQLKFNAQKCKSMHLGRNNQTQS